LSARKDETTLAAESSVFWEEKSGRL
jgi:hypothetical protein